MRLYREGVKGLIKGHTRNSNFRSYGPLMTPYTTSLQVPEVNVLGNYR